MGFIRGLFFVIFKERNDELTSRYNTCPTHPCAHYGLLPIEIGDSQTCFPLSDYRRAELIIDPKGIGDIIDNFIPIVTIKLFGDRF